MRFKYQNVWQAGSGQIVEAGTVTVYLAGTSTLATIYAAETGAADSDSAVASDSSGVFEFWVDAVDYPTSQEFKLVLSKTLFNSQPYDNVKIFPDGLNSYLLGDGDDLQTAVTAAGSTVTSIRIDGAIVIPSGTTVSIPTTLGIKFTHAGSIDGVSGGGTETLAFATGHHGPIAGPWGIFGSNLVVTGIKTGYPEWTGAVGDMSTDDTAALAAIFSASSSVYLSKEYLFSSNLQLKSDFKLYGPGTLYRNSDVRLVAGSSAGAALTGSGAIAAGSPYITLSAGSYASVSVGDWLFIETDTTPADIIAEFVATPNTNTDWVYYSQVVKILSKEGSNVVKVHVSAAVDYNFATTARVFTRTDVVENVTIDGITFLNGAGLSGSSTEAAFINVINLFDFKLKNCAFDLKTYTGGIFITFGQAKITGNTFTEGEYLNIFFRQSCQDSIIASNVFESKHGNDTSVFLETGNSNVAIIGNTFNGSNVFDSTVTNAAKLISAIQFDAKVHNCTISGNTITGYGVGVRLELGSRNNTITGNTFSHCFIEGLRFNGTRSNVITGNSFINTPVATTAEGGTLSDAMYAILLASSYNTTITGNTFEWVSSPTDGGAVSIGGDFNSFTGNTIIGEQGFVLVLGSNNTVSHNKLLDVVATYAMQTTGSTYHNNKFIFNTIYNTGSGVGLRTGSECNTVSNNFFGPDVTYAVFLDSTSEAQSIFENVYEWDADTGTKGISNVDITAPVMPTNAVMPNQFRIYESYNSSSSLSPQGAKWWEFKKFLGGTGDIFREFSITNSQVVI